jgi:anti-sigma-K factor RskA
MSTYSREELFELAAAYALGATTADETAAVEAALATSPELVAEVRSFRDVVAELGRLAPMPPSQDARGRLLERVRREPIPASDGPAFSSPPPARHWTRRFGAYAAAAGIVAIISLGVETFRLLEQERTVEASRAAVVAKLDHRETELNTLLLAEKDLRVIHLKGADTVNGPGIQFFWNEKQRSGMVHAFRLPPAPPHHAYQIWAIVDGRPTSMKVFDSDPDGHALVQSLDMPPTSRGTTAIYVTVEPSGGSPAPTTEPFLRGTVSATY